MSSVFPDPDEVIRFSVVVPAYNEERYLPALLDSLWEAARSSEVSRGRTEIIVANNASTDRTAEVAQERGCRVVRVENRVIAAARNGGAAAARGEILCFVDADFRVHPQTFNEIDRALASEKYVAGATGVRPERWSVGFAILWAVFVPMVALTRFDTGVVFCRRSDFETVGGYDEKRVMAEDVDFLFRIWRLGSRRRQRLVRLKGAKAIASMRKFDQFGEWHYFGLIAVGVVKWLRGGEALKEFADRYWYKPPR